jgi:CDGSH-type Zn-finger protein/uncharacterized Fe-S cluster protein YjdI
MEIVKGRDVTITFDGTRCIHARNCVLSHPEVFVPKVKGDWIFPDAASAEVVVRLGITCPSGAIRVARNDGAPGSEVPPVVNTLRLRENGPLALEAPMVVAGQTGAAVRAVLCRCGASTHKPYCDGSHVAAGFQATGEPTVKDSAPLAARDGVVEVLPKRNGPLRMTGIVEVVSGTGHTVNRATQLFLCRCGQSANKPYCDGTHAKTDFQAEGA